MQTHVKLHHVMDLTSGGPWHISHDRVSHDPNPMKSLIIGK